MKIPNIINTPTTYYIIIKFPHYFSFGAYHNTAYKTLRNAEKTARKLIESGMYDLVTIRREDVTCRTANTEISSSSPIKKIWKNDAVRREHDALLPDLA